MAEDLFKQINRVEDLDSATDFEKKHLPVIKVPEKIDLGMPFPVTVEVGKLVDHPNEKEHFIQWIELFAGEVFLGRVDLTAETTSPKVTFNVVMEDEPKELRAVESCNLHGLWEFRKKPEVKV